MGKFKTECGIKFDSNHDCFMSGVTIERIYPQSMKEESMRMSPKCKQCKAKKKTKKFFRIDINLEKTFTTTETVCFAKNVDFTNKILVNEYNTPSSNLKQTMMIEVVLHDENCRTYLYLDHVGMGFNFLESFDSSLEDYWYELKEKAEDEITITMFDMEDGQIVPIFIESFDALKDMVISVRLVDYLSEIKEEL